jgi:alpha-ribazole phosphatase
MVEVTTHITTAQSDEGQNTRRLWLVRHGLTEWNTQQRYCGHCDIPLSGQGRTQALWLAERLQEEMICAIYASDLVRARETAEIIARQRTPAVQIRVSAAWREIDFGDWEGLTYAQIAEQFKDQLGFFTAPEHCSPPNGEPLAHMQRRVMDALSAIVQSDDSPTAGDAVIVSHGGPLRVLLCSLLGMPLQRQWQLRLDPGSLSAIDLLPVHEPATPRAVLALLNDRHAMHADHSAKSPALTGAASENRREQGTMRNV